MESNQTLYEQGICLLDHCSEKGLLLPIICEQTWSKNARAFLYLIGLLYCFLGVAIVADIFMCAIEKITSKTKRIIVAKPGAFDTTQEVEVKVWNGTVANLTLMALGSSAPEILLSCIEIIGNNFKAGDLGPGTIVGSAAFNLLVITAVCLFSIPNGEVRRLQNIKVFAVTAFSSVFAYIWLYIILVVSSKNELDIWEAVLTLLFFPLLVVVAYIADKDFCGKRATANLTQLEMGIKTEKELEAARLAQGKLDKEAVADFMREITKFPGVTPEDAARLAAARLQESVSHDPGWYRVSAIRTITGGRKVIPSLEERLREVYELVKMQETRGEIAADGGPDVVPKIPTVIEEKHAIVEFAAASCAVMENDKKVLVVMVRHGNTKNRARFRYETIDGTAEATKDYIAQRGEVIMEPGEIEKNIEIEIIDDNEWEPDEAFFVKMSVDPEDEDEVVLGPKSINQIIIINDDEPGMVEFEKPSFLVKESVGIAEIPVNRYNGADGTITVNWKTRDKSAINNKDFIGGQGVLEFGHGEITKMIEITIINDKESEKDENFEISLNTPTGGATLGKTVRTIVTIVNDDDFNSMVSRVLGMTKVNMDALRVESSTWASQFHDAMNVNGGDIENATSVDYVMHFLTFGWKIIFALIPPPSILGGWLCFIISLIMIGLLTAIVGDLAGIFGCLIGLKDAVTAITFVALGTSLPDLFASKQAAAMEKYADNSIGNVTGSNSVNVFLGLGLPWLIASIYWMAKDGSTFVVPAGSLSFSVALYAICAVITIAILLIRRYMGIFGHAELGGPFGPKLACSLFIVTLWLLYVLLSALQIYEHIPGF